MHVDGIIVGELCGISMKSVDVGTMGKMLVDFEQIKMVSREVGKSMEAQNPVFKLPNFSIFDCLLTKGREKPESNEEIELLESGS